MNTTENNKLIAEFMGYEWFEVNKPYIAVREINGGIKHFQTDWNDLMQVVEKIESLGYRTLTENECFMITKNKLKPFDVRSKDDYSIIFSNNYEINRYDNTKLSNTYMAIVEFIKWYNEQK